MEALQNDKQALTKTNSSLQMQLEKTTSQVESLQKSMEEIGREKATLAGTNLIKFEIIQSLEEYLRLYVLNFRE